jgi:predicted DNA-binding helix-hairpin-helix protein
MPCVFTEKHARTREAAQPPEPIPGFSRINAKKSHLRMVSLEKAAALCCGGAYDTASAPAQLEKVRALGKGTAMDACASTASRRQSEGGIGHALKSGICHSFTPDGRCVSLFKTLYTNACSHDCFYCPNSTSCKSRQKIFSYSPEELASIVLSLYSGNYIEGLFLSSGAGRDPDSSMRGMLDAVRILREKKKFNGYVHMKVLPGVSQSSIREAVELSDRVSINIEAPSYSRMSEMGSTKHFRNDILRRQEYVAHEVRRQKSGAGHTTQMILGCAGESDLEIFARMRMQYAEMGVKRVYYSSFSPACGTPFQKKPAQALWRESRLYQLDWLYRVYRIGEKRLTRAFDEEGLLPDRDPKITLARAFLDGPVDPNSAAYDDLLMVPGIGPQSAWRIMQARRDGKLDSCAKLSRLGVGMKRASAFLNIGGFCQSSLGDFL